MSSHKTVAYKTLVSELAIQNLVRQLSSEQFAAFFATNYLPLVQFGSNLPKYQDQLCMQNNRRFLALRTDNYNFRMNQYINVR